MPPSIGGYVLEAKLGQGGMGAVWRAHHPAAPGRAVALKVLTGTPGPAGLERFKREVQALVAAGGHPGVVRIFAGGLETQPPYYVMELVEGESLEAALRRGPLEPRRAALVVRAVADAIAFAHGHGILHRDLKPANVLLERSVGAEDGATERARVCDFGVARLASAERLTRTGVFVGSAVWAAPEQFAGDAASIDERTDVHGLGALLWAALAGGSPFDREIAQAGRRLLGTAAPSVRTSAPGVPRELDAVCARALEERPAQRYPTAAAFRDDLDRWLRGEAPEAFAARPTTAIRARRVARAVSLVALATVVAALAVFLVKVRARAGRIAALAASAAREGATAAEMRASIEQLEKEGASGGLIGHVHERLETRELEERIAAARPARAGDPGSLEALESAALAAIRLPDRASLCGEREGLPLGDALLDAREALLDAPTVSPRPVATPGTRATSGSRAGAETAPVASRAATLLERAERLASARLASAPRDPAGHLLEARVALARAGAPPRALGAGELGRPEATAASVIADLELASADGAAVGAEADWLLVDLLASAGPSSEVRAQAALARARERHPGSKARPVLEQALGATPDAEGLLQLTRRLRPGDEAFAAALALSRFAARLGSPRALEHPELLVDPLAADRIAGRETWPPPPKSGRPRRVQLLEGSFNALDRRRVAGEITADQERVPFEAALVEAIELAPRDPLILWHAAESWRRPFSATYFNVLLGSVTLAGESARLTQLFEPSLRMAHVPQEGTNWNTGRGVEACAEVDRRFSEALERDPVIAAIRPSLGPLHEDVVAACLAARRIEELEDPPEDEHARARLAFDALVGLEHFVAVGPDVGFLFRARARRVAIPAPFGPALARLDLARLERYWRDGAQEPPDAPFLVRKLSEAVFLAANLAVRTPGASLQEEHLLALAAHLAHEAAVMTAFDEHDPGALDRTLNEMASGFEIDSRYRDVFGEGARHAILEPTADDRAAVARASHVYRAPPGGRLPSLPLDNARIVSVRLTPTASRRTFAIECEVINTGASTWDDTYCLGVSGAQGERRAFETDLPEGMFVADGEHVAPNERHVFRFELDRPGTAGTWELAIRMKQLAVAWFGEQNDVTFVVPE